MTATGPAPTAQGAFAKTPLPHLLVYALERALSGTFELRVADQSLATMLVIQGVPAKVRLSEGVHYLGEVMLELGLITKEQLDASLERMQESPRLQGQILCELGASDAARVEMGVRAQLERKLEHLFTLPPETLFDYFDGIDVLQRYGGPPTPIDPLPVLWRGVRQAPAWEHVDGTLRRVGQAGVRISQGAQIERFQLGRGEAAAVDLLRQRPMRVVDLAGAKVIGPSVAQLLVYTLIITKQVDLIEPARLSQTGPAAAPAAPAPPGTPAAVAPAAPASGSVAPAPASSNPLVGPPPSSSNPVLSQAAQSQAFARVQLQARQVTRSPVVVEEVARTSGRDTRIASPLPQPIPLGDALMTPDTALAPGVPGGMNIGEMISQSISSLPPPNESSRPGAASPPPPISSGQLPPPPPSAPVLTAEQSSLKQKIIERAALITSQDYFQMLGIDQDAPPEAVNKAFLLLAKVWHPDRLPPALVDVKDACTKVFAHLTEANATLTDDDRRTQYMRLLKDGGATPDDQAKIQDVLQAATDFQKAEFHLKRNELAQAYEIAKRAHALDDEQADYLAMITWIEAQKPEWSGREKTLEKIAVLERCIKMNQHCERAHFWRGMLYKRIDEASKANKDFKRAAELNPRNLDAMREVRLYTMRGGTKPPPPNNGPASGSGRPSKPPQPEKLGGLFGKLFKK